MTRNFTALLASLACLGPAIAAGSDSTSPIASQTSQDELRKLPGGAILKVARGTQYSLGQPIGVQLGSRPERTLAQSVHLVTGRVEVELPKGKSHGTAVIIQAPRRVSAVAKGGRSVIIADANRVTVAAISEEMLVAGGNRWRALPSGHVREFVNGTATADHPALAAPKTSLSSAMALVVDGADTLITATVSQVPNAAAYEFTLWRSDGEKRVPVKRVKAVDGRTSLDPMAPGSYAVSAHALETSGLEGPESALSPLRIVAIALSDGAKLVEGGILLARSQRLSLLGAEGMEVSYGRAPSFVPAPSTIGIIRNEPTTVRLRSRGTKEELSLKLIPRRLHADVQLGPARASWPSDEVTVSVRLTDGLGRPIADSGALKPSVFVNVTPVNVKWKRDRNLLTASVPRDPTQAGPWVVRVEVADDTGVLVGRDFLEVAAVAPPHR